MYKNLFAFTAKKLGEDTWFQVYATNEKECWKELSKFLKQDELLLIGYNNLHYDNPVTKKYLISKSVEEAYQLSKSIVEDNIHAPYEKRFYPPTLDLMLAGNFINPKRLSLKQLAVNLNFPIIKDLPYNPHLELDEYQISQVLTYNKNDCLITEALFLNKSVKEEIELKIGIGQEYDLTQAYNKDRTMLAKALLVKLFLEPNGYSKDLRTYRNKIKLADIISPKIKFNSPELKLLLEKLKKKTIYPFKKERKGKSSDYWENKERIDFANLILDMGAGGIHSLDKAGVFNNPDKIIVDYDVRGFYPEIMRILGICPSHFDKNLFIPAFSRIIDERIDAKKQGLKHKAEALKIVVNAIFGMTNSELSFMYDPQAMMSVTINGQLFILMLVEMMHQYGIKIVSANTDGVSIEIEPNELSKANKIAKLWNSQTGFELEGLSPLDDNKYSFYVRSHVNGYIMKSLKGKIKSKGIFVEDKDLAKGFKHPIVYRALREYFLNNAKPETTIQNETNIYQFCITQRTSNDYQVFYRTLSSLNPMQKSNRYYVSTNNREGGRLYKVINEKGILREKEELKELETQYEKAKKGKLSTEERKKWEAKVVNKKNRIASPPEIDFVAGKTLMIANDLTLDKSIKEYKIDYDWYIKETYKIIAKIKFADEKDKERMKSMKREELDLVQETMF